MTDANPLRLLGIREAAQLLGTDKENVLAWINSGVLPCVRVGRRGEPRVSAVMLEAWQRCLGTSQSASQRRPSRRAPGRPSAPLQVIR